MSDIEEAVWDDSQTRKDPGPIVDAIKGGEYDGGLVQILEACRFRFQMGSTRKKWKIDASIVGHEGLITEDDLLVEHAATVERQTSTSWGYLNPLTSAQECQAIVAAWLHHTHGVALKDAMGQVGKIPVSEMVDAISAYEVDAVPKDR